MKKYIFIVLALLLSAGTADINAQSFFKKIKKAVESEVTNKVNKVKKSSSEKSSEKSSSSKSSSSKSSSSQKKMTFEERNEAHLKILEERGEIVRPKIVNTTSIQEGPATGKTNGHEWVDLGLPSGTRWATCNIGATTPEQPGGLYAWGEMATKTSYMPSNSKTHGKNLDDISGNATYDIATAKWGKDWRMPTKAEYEELLRYCDYKYVKKGNLWGHQFTNSKNGRSIFLPSTGHKEHSSKIENAGVCGNYWASTPHKCSYNNGAHCYIFGAALGEMSIGERSSGFGVRAVSTNNTMTIVPSQGQTNGHKWVDLGLPSGTKWATFQLGASSSEEFGDRYQWGSILPITERGETPFREKETTDIGGNPKYDPATALWGKNWRMPTSAEFKELFDNCTWEWTNLGRIFGCKAISKINGNYIFFPVPNGAQFVALWASDPSVGVESYNAFFSQKSISIRTSGMRYNEFFIHHVTK